MGVTPSIPRDPTRKIQVIGAGYSRTGTSTFAVVMEKLLNGPVHHGGSQLIGASDARVKKMVELLKYRNDKPRCLKTLQEVTAGFVSICDAPGICFVEELCELFPDAVIICVKRDKAKWWKSLAPVVNNASTWWLDVLLWPTPGWRWFPAAMKMFDERNKELYGISFCEEMYDRHIEHVKRVVPKDRLHFVDLKNGWKPFCDILGVPIPQEPFPHLNDAEAADRMFKKIVIEAIGLWAVILGLVGGTMYMAIRSSTFRGVGV